LNKKNVELQLVKSQFYILCIDIVLLITLIEISGIELKKERQSYKQLKLNNE